MADDPRPRSRFHGRFARDEGCAVAGCAAPGEFRAPLAPGGFDGPGRWRWLCLDHVKAFNARYNYFAGMTADEITAAQTPLAGWERETRAFAHAGGDPAPSWANFRDPLEAISGRFRRAPVAPERSDGVVLSGEDRRDLATLGLNIDADRRALRNRYSELVRRYHPDRNGGDRSHERALSDTIAAYQRLKRAPAFA